MERRLTGMIAAAAVLILLFIFWDIFRPTQRVARAESDSIPTRIETPPPNPMATTTSQGAVLPAAPTAPTAPIGGVIGGREPAHLDLLARPRTRRPPPPRGNRPDPREIFAAREGSLRGPPGQWPT